jgi:hypothetical protein
VALIRFAVMSPLLMLIVATVVVQIAKLSGARIAPVNQLSVRSAMLGAAGAGATLLYTIASMIWYEHTTGFSAGNGPLGWIFLFGPLGFSFGQLVALVWWWLQRPRAVVDGAP